MLLTTVYFALQETHALLRWLSVACLREGLSNALNVAGGFFFFWHAYFVLLCGEMNLKKNQQVWGEITTEFSEQIKVSDLTVRGGS